MSGTTLSGGFRLGDLQVNPQAGDVTGPGGRVQLDPKVMGVFAMLAEHAGQVVSREDLHARLWPNVVVTDDALSRCLYDLRRQLATAGGSDAHRALVETLPKRGYRLNGAVQALEAPGPAAPSRALPSGRPWLWAAGVAASVILVAGVLSMRDHEGADAGTSATPAATSRIAVLPFTDLSEAQDQQYFADGLAEEILDRLTRSTDLSVIARTSSFWFRGKDADLAEVARKLDVTHVLEGSVRRSGERLRVTAQLIATHDSSHVWSTTFERRTGDVFAIQDEIAAGVATALGAALTRRDSEAVPLPSREAHERFLRAEFLYHRRAAGDIERAVAEYEAAVASAPEYAQAWAALAGAYSYLAWQMDPPAPGLLEKQRLAAERAVELDPELAIARIRLARYLFESGRLDEARSQQAMARQLDPVHPIVLSWEANDATLRGDFPAAVAGLRQAIAREPLSPLYRSNLAVLLVADGQLEEALAEFRWIMELAPPSRPDLQTEIVRILILQGRYAEARAALAEVPEGKRHDHAQALMFSAPGERERADAAFTRLLAGPRDGSTEERIGDTIHLAEAQAVRGDLNGALATLQSTFDQFARGPAPNKGGMWVLKYEARVSPFLKPLHPDPRWAAIFDRVG